MLLCCCAICSLSVVTTATRFDAAWRLVSTASTATASARRPATVRDDDAAVRRRHRRLDSPSTSRSALSVTRRPQVMTTERRGHHLHPAIPTVRRYDCTSISSLQCMVAGSQGGAMDHGTCRRAVATNGCGHAFLALLVVHTMLTDRSTALCLCHSSFYSYVKSSRNHPL